MLLRALEPRNMAHWVALTLRWTHVDRRRKEEDRDLDKGESPNEGKYCQAQVYLENPKEDLLGGEDRGQKRKKANLPREETLRGRQGLELFYLYLLFVDRQRSNH